MVRYVRFYTRWHRRENDQFSTLRCTKTGSTQPKLSAACFVVQSCLADADFVVFSNYCLIGTRQMSACFFNTAQAHDEFSDCFWANSQNCFQDAELAALVYPRRLWIDAADGDELFPCNMAQAELERLKAIRADGWDGLRFRIFKGVHEFPIDDTGIEYVVQALK